MGVSKIIWLPQNNNRLTAVADAPEGYFDMLNEHDLDPIQLWCEEHNCGKRTSFDTFQFKTQKEKTMFLLKWG